MTLESLRSSKFTKTVISKKMQAMISGGGQYDTSYQAQGSGHDTATLSCSGPNGDLYDRAISFDTGGSTYEESQTMYQGTTADMYN